VPTLRVEAFQTAAPVAFRGADPRMVPLSTNVTVPVGGFAPMAVTAAVKVIFSAEVAGLALEVRVVVVAVSTAWTSMRMVLVEGAELAFPVYIAVIVWFPGASIRDERAAAPLESSVADPMEAEPSRNVTVPVMGPCAPATIAV
jgi:hypothetical protein